jgi:hypothetical protein
MHAALIETVPPRTLRSLAESLQVGLSALVEHVVLPGNEKHRNESSVSTC